MENEELRIKLNNIKFPIFRRARFYQFSNVSCFILVGGKSSRFGDEKDDKAAIFYKPQYDKCKKIFKNVYFVAKYKKFKNYPFFIEKSKIYAPLPAIEEVVKKYKKVFILSVDTPLISQKSIIKLIQKKAIAKNNPLIGYYDYTHLPKIRSNLKGKMKVFGINKKEINIKENELINVNYLEDLKKI